MLRSIALIGMLLATTASAQQVTPSFGLDSSGSLRQLYVRDPTLPGFVPMGTLNTTSHTFSTPQPAVLVESYGAISGDALDDKVAIQAAITAATAQGRCVSGSSQTYLVNGYINLINGACLQDIKLTETGTGVQRPITSDCGSGAPFTSCLGPHTLRRVKVDRGLSDSWSDSGGIYLANCNKGTLLEDVEVTGNGAGGGILLPNCSNVKLIRPWVHDMEWTNTTGIDPGIEQMQGIGIGPGSNISIIDARVENLFGIIPWIAGQNLVPSQGLPWRTNAGNAYRSTTAGSVAPTTSGTTPPTCTGTPGVSTCSDGNKTWTYMGPAATTKRAYQADGIGMHSPSNVTMIGGTISKVWEGVDIGAADNVWLYGVTFLDVDGWGEKWCHATKNSGSVGTRAFRSGIGGVVTCQENVGVEPPHKQIRIVSPMVVDSGANGNWSYAAASGIQVSTSDVWVINPVAVDTQTVPTMKYGFWSNAVTMVGAPVLINPYTSGATISNRIGNWSSILEGPFGTAIAANTGTSGHVVPYLDAPLNTWSGGAGTLTRQYLVAHATGAETIPLALLNGGGSPNVGVVIDLSPTNNAPGVRSAQIASLSEGGNSDANLVFRTAFGTAPTDRMKIDKIGSVLVGAPASGGKGFGTINTQSGLYQNGEQVATLGPSTNTFTGPQVYTATGVTTNLYVNGTFDTAQALALAFRKSRATPTNGDGLAAISFQGTNSAAAAVEYAEIKALADTVTAGSELGTLRFYTGTATAERMRIGLGVQFGNGSLADPGLGNLRAQFGVQVGVSSVSALPTCTAALEGMMRSVTDANATTYNSVAAGSGVNHMAVRCNGTAWVLH